MTMLHHPAAFAGAAVLREPAVVILDAVAVIVVLDGGLDGLLRQHGAVELVGGQAAQGVHHLAVGNGQGLVDGLALDHLGGHGGRGDGAAAAEGLELHVLDDVVPDFQVHLHNVAALGVAHLAHAVGVFDLTHIAGVHEMIHHDIAVQCHIQNAPFVVTA